jgi:hypothetical protein
VKIETYTEGDEDWPALWRLPDEHFDNDIDERGGDAMTAFVDDQCLRHAVHCWDNMLRLPGTESAMVGGLLGAACRAIIALGPEGATVEDIKGVVGDVLDVLLPTMLEVNQNGSWVPE